MFQAPRQLAPGEQYAVLAGQAFQTNIRPKADNLPFISAAGMRFTQANDLTKLEIR